MAKNKSMSSIGIAVATRLKKGFSNNPKNILKQCFIKIAQIDLKLYNYLVANKKNPELMELMKSRYKALDSIYKNIDSIRDENKDAIIKESIENTLLSKKIIKNENVPTESILNGIKDAYKSNDLKPKSYEYYNESLNIHIKYDKEKKQITKSSIKNDQEESKTESSDLETHLINPQGENNAKEHFHQTGQSSKDGSTDLVDNEGSGTSTLLATKALKDETKIEEKHAEAINTLTENHQKAKPNAPNNEPKIEEKHAEAINTLTENHQKATPLSNPVVLPAKVEKLNKSSDRTPKSSSPTERIDLLDLIGYFVCGIMLLMGVGYAAGINVSNSGVRASVFVISAILPIVSIVLSFNSMKVIQNEKRIKVSAAVALPAVSAVCVMITNLYVYLINMNVMSLCELLIHLSMTLLVVMSMSVCIWRDVYDEMLMCGVNVLMIIGYVIRRACINGSDVAMKLKNVVEIGLVVMPILAYVMMQVFRKIQKNKKEMKEKVQNEVQQGNKNEDRWTKIRMIVSFVGMVGMTFGWVLSSSQNVSVNNVAGYACELEST
ncbi:hypothetical protein M896_060050 [Ordospora colligata OC4]|uniref:Uncharacterized protein n=1 Tax=Ordospora colligata OC4 TaxID=1354746 RepID=A0A0B2UKD1_9MICR|nr:uncharacterized protein M896_060050 [Ordospora colligata OC4]KHN69507.1 hypothetical protein M896_060050 [Ordospora colligata OC4]